MKGQQDTTETVALRTPSDDEELSPADLSEGLFQGEETVPLRDDSERREDGEREARLRLILPPRRRRWW